MRTQFDQDLLDLLALDRLPEAELTERERAERFRLDQAIDNQLDELVKLGKALEKAA